MLILTSNTLLIESITSMIVSLSRVLIIPIIFCFLATIMRIMLRSTDNSDYYENAEDSQEDLLEEEESQYFTTYQEQELEELKRKYQEPPEEHLSNTPPDTDIYNDSTESTPIPSQVSEDDTCLVSDITTGLLQKTQDAQNPLLNTAPLSTNYEESLQKYEKWAEEILSSKKEDFIL